MSMNLSTKCKQCLASSPQGVLQKEHFFCGKGLASIKGCGMAPMNIECSVSTMFILFTGQRPRPEYNGEI
jgi:hypothetical protein